MPKFVSTLHLSKFFVLIQCIMLIGSVISVCCLPFSVLTKGMLILSLLVYSAWNFYSNNQWRVIGQDIDGWYLEKAGERIFLNLCGESTVTSFVSILRFTRAETFLKQSCIIFNDAMPRDLYRQLIVRMNSTSGSSHQDNLINKPLPQASIEH